MTALLLPLLAVTLAAPAEGHEVAFEVGKQTHRFSLVVNTEKGPLTALEARLLAGWRPTEDGSDPLDHLVPEGRLLRVEVMAPSPYAEPLTRALFGALDRDGDGRVTREDLRDAERRWLASFDADEDGCLTALEIVPDLLSRKRVHINHEPLLKRGPLLQLELSVKRQVVRSGGLLLDLASSPPRQGDIPLPPRSLLRPGREKDRGKFEQVARAVVTLSVRPQVRGWFEILDADGDGQLSPREMRAAWDRLADEDARKVGFLTLPDFAAPAVSLTASPGISPRPAVVLTRKQLARRGPAWFLAMDRNGDGDLSRDEFLGSDEEFRSYDADGDGLISSDEAEVGDRKRKKETTHE